MLKPCYSHATAMLLPRNCHAIAMPLGARRASRHLQRAYLINCHALDNLINSNNLDNLDYIKLHNNTCNKDFL